MSSDISALSSRVATCTERSLNLTAFSIPGSGKSWKTTRVLDSRKIYCDGFGIYGKHKKIVIRVTLQPLHIVLRLWKHKRCHFSLI